MKLSQQQQLIILTIYIFPAPRKKKFERKEGRASLRFVPLIYLLPVLLERGGGMKRREKKKIEN